MARSSLAAPAMVNLLRPFVLTAAHSGKADLAQAEPAVREIFTKSKLSKDPNRSNVFMFVLDSQGEVIHEFHGLPAGARPAGPGRSNHQAAIQAARAKIKLPDLPQAPPDGQPKGLPDFPTSGGGAPAGIRMFIRQLDAKDSRYVHQPIVELVPMTAEEWKALAQAPQAKEIAADTLKNWLVWLYPAAIRAVDEQKRYQNFDGTLKLEPAGQDEKSRYALLRGKVKLTKANETESSFEGEIQAVISYRHDAPDVASIRGVIEGVFHYRTRGTTPMKLAVALESRPK